jgi:hypothetical protein
MRLRIEFAFQKVNVTLTQTCYTILVTFLVIVNVMSVRWCY